MKRNRIPVVLMVVLGLLAWQSATFAAEHEDYLSALLSPRKIQIFPPLDYLSDLKEDYRRVGARPFLARLVEQGHDPAELCARIEGRSSWDITNDCVSYDYVPMPVRPCLCKYRPGIGYVCSGLYKMIHQYVYDPIEVEIETQSRVKLKP